MTFGEVLRLLLEANEIKQTQLAAFLGYDVSYISKWIGGSKLPSVKNNSTLFLRIAKFISDELTESGREELERVLLPYYPKEGTDFSQWIAGILLDVCAQSPAIKRPAMTSPLVLNSALAFGSDTDEGNKIIIDSLSDYSYSSCAPELNVFIISPVGDYGHGECRKLWEAADVAVDPEKRIHISVVTTFDGISESDSIAICEDLLVFKFGLPERITVDIYLDPAPGSREPDKLIWLCKDAFLCTTYKDSVCGRTFILRTRDSGIVKDYYSAVRKYLRGYAPVIKQSSFQQLYVQKFFRMFYMSRNVRSLHTVMPITLASRRICSMLEDKFGIPGHVADIYSFAQNNLEKYAMVVYRSSVADFIFDGRVNVFGRTVHLAPGDRNEYIQYLRAQIESGLVELTVVEDVNPIINKDDIRVSLYVGDGSFHAFRLSCADAVDNIFHSDNVPLVDHMRRFVDAFHSLPAEFILCGSQAVDYLGQLQNYIS